MPSRTATGEAVRYLLEQQTLVRAPFKQLDADTPLGPFSVGTFAPFSLPGQAFVHFGRLRFYVKRVSAILGFWISCNVSPTGQAIVAQLQVSGVVTGAIASIDPGNFVSPEVRPGSLFLDADNWITMDITQVGNGGIFGGDVVGHIELATLAAQAAL